MKLENGPHNVVPTPSVLDHLYRHSDKDLEQFLYEGTKEYENHFLNKKAEEWIQLMKDVFSSMYELPLLQELMSGRPTTSF